MKPVILSGIQPSGRLHIGNYFGALKNFVDLQNSGEYECRFMIADLHSLTEAYTPDEKRAQIADLAASYLAAGLNLKKSILFVQSKVPAHSELAWIFNTITPRSELELMTQYKDKKGAKPSHLEIYDATKLNPMMPPGSEALIKERMEEARKTIVISIDNAGLLTYPVLMAADILLYDSSVIPVGDDQDQHLELTRTIARKFNGRFGQTFIEPKAKHTEIPRLMSLADPMKKMSKSQPSGCLFLDDEPEVVKKKIMSAVTDSGSEVKFDETGKPGISNLLRIASAITGKTIAALEAEFVGKNYGQFKTYVADVTADYLAPIRTKKAELMKNPAKVLKIFEAGSKKANKIASEKLKDVYKKVGLI